MAPLTSIKKRKLKNKTILFKSSQTKQNKIFAFFLDPECQRVKPTQYLNLFQIVSDSLENALNQIIKVLFS